MHHYKIKILEHHLDTFGHMNNAMYLELYEEARWDLITANGFGLKEIQEQGVGPVILEVNVRFQKEIKLREEITITSVLIESKGKICTMKQQMIKADGSSASEALFKFGLFDLKTRKLLEPTELWKKAIGYP